MSELLESRRCFSGELKRFSHASSTLNCSMHVSVYIPEQAHEAPCPAIYWLSGLTCTDRNFVEKSGFARVASELGLVIIAPDTSPRGQHIPDNDSDALGQGASFYLNATQSPWQEHFQMESYITEELIEWAQAGLPITTSRAIAGHSMGGHGALTLALKHPAMYESVSAFSPISHPMNCPWGQDAFSAYLGEDRALWRAHDACELLAKSPSPIPMRIDQGLADPFLNDQLQPEALTQAAKEHEAPLTMFYHEGFDHSYFFVSTFIEEQLRFHAKYLSA